MLGFINISRIVWHQELCLFSQDKCRGLLYYIPVLEEPGLVDCIKSQRKSEQCCVCSQVVISRIRKVKLQK